MYSAQSGQITPYRRSYPLEEEPEYEDHPFQQYVWLSRVHAETSLEGDKTLFNTEYCTAQYVGK